MHWINVQMGRYSSPSYWCVMYRWLYTCINRNLNQSVLYGLTWQVTARVWHIWVFPVRNSPNISVILPVSTPPPSSLSSSYNHDNHTINVIDQKMSNWSNQHISAATYKKTEAIYIMRMLETPIFKSGSHISLHRRQECRLLTVPCYLLWVVLFLLVSDEILWLL